MAIGRKSRMAYALWGNEDSAIPGSPAERPPAGDGLFHAGLPSWGQCLARAQNDRVRGKVTRRSGRSTANRGRLSRRVDRSGGWPGGTGPGVG